MEVTDHERDARRRKLWRWLIVAAVLVLLVGGAFAGRKIYKTQQPKRLANKAREFLQRDDFRNAVLTARRALQIDPRNVDANNVMAELAERFGARDALQWRQRVADIQRDSVTAHVVWANTALRLGELDVAQTALDRVKEQGESSAEYHGTAGTLAIARGNTKEAERHYRRAVELAPENGVNVFNEAMVQLQSSEPAVVERAVGTLNKLLKDDRYRPFARRALIRHYSDRSDLATAEKLSIEQQKDPGAVFADTLAYLEILHRSKSPALAGVMEEVKAKAKETPADLGALVAWMNKQGMSADALQWAADWPKELRDHEKVSPALAVSYMMQNDSAGLHALIKEGQWGSLEYLRSTYLARLLREQGDTNGFRAHWNSALAAAGNDEGAMRRLAEMSSAWGWKDEFRDALWSMAERSKHPEWALDQLYRYYAQLGDTRGLLRVSGKILETQPENLAAKNNFAMFSLLLGSNVDRAVGMAREVYEREKENANYVSTYAFALHVQGKTDEGLAIIKGLPEEKLREPAVAAYYGILLAAKGDARAEEYLGLGAGAKLLQEEQELVKEAREKK
jgi:tetratricopeptide (TPR) repeat protein